MDTPLPMPADPTPVPSLWRAISSLRVVRRLLGIPDEVAGRTGAPVGRGLGTIDWDEPDTSLTQAELEVLK